MAWGERRCKEREGKEGRSKEASKTGGCGRMGWKRQRGWNLSSRVLAARAVFVGRCMRGGWNATCARHVIKFLLWGEREKAPNFAKVASNRRPSFDTLLCHFSPPPSCLPLSFALCWGCGWLLGHSCKRCVLLGGVGEKYEKHGRRDQREEQGKSQMCKYSWVRVGDRSEFRVSFARHKFNCLLRCANFWMRESYLLKPNTLGLEKELKGQALHDNTTAKVQSCPLNWISTGNKKRRT